MIATEPEPGPAAALQMEQLMADTYQELLSTLVLDEQRFVQLTMQGIVRGPAIPWRKIVVRPVAIKNQRHLQISWFDAKRDITKNYRGAEAARKVAEILAIPFSSIHVQTTAEDVHVQLTKRGKAIVRRRSVPGGRQMPSLAHNRSKALPLPADKPDSFLQAIGLMDGQGRIRPSMQSKFTQINELLKLLDHTGELEKFERFPVTIVDCGCGAAYLTCAVYHYLNNIRRIPARLIGVDVDAELIRKDMAYSERLAAPDLCFERSAIVEFQPTVAPDIVLALHACDTATDEAIAQAIRWNARLLLCAPCCHRDLQRQLPSDVLRPIMRHGILKQRMGDILTDTFRALILRIMGYRTEIVEFVASEHTAKNLLIRAVKATALGDAAFVREYTELKAFWRVTPYLEHLLGQAFQRLLGASG